MFKNCTSITNIIIPNSITHIWDEAFSGCNSLMNIIIPNSVTNIYDNAFNDCSNLNTVTIVDNGGNTEDVKSKLIAAGVKSDVNWILS